MATSGSTHDRRDADRPVRWLLGAAGISSLGDGLAVVALPLLATRLTTDPRLIAGLLVAERLPWLILSLPAGALADRFPRLQLMRIADVLRAVVLLVAGIGSLSGRLSLPTLYLLALALGAAETVFSMASQAALADLVPLDRLDRANGYLFSTQSGGEQLIGPALGGLVFAASASAPLLIDGFSFLASAALLAQVARTVPSHNASASPGWSARLAPAAALPAGAAGGEAGAGGLDPAVGIKAGLRAFAATPVLRVLLLLLAGLGVCQAMVLALVVVYATRTLHLGSAEYGLFIAAGSLGNVAGGFAVARIRVWVGTATIMTASAVAAASAYLILAATSSTLVAVAAFVVESFAVACGCVASLTVRQSAVPAELRGRIASIFRMAIYGAVPLGAMAGGVLAATGGVRLPLVVAGLLQLALAAATARPLRRRLPALARTAHTVLQPAAASA
jgi:MFS family permease